MLVDLGAAPRWDIHTTEYSLLSLDGYQSLHAVIVHDSNDVRLVLPCHASQRLVTVILSATPSVSTST